MSVCPQSRRAFAVLTALAAMVVSATAQAAPTLKTPYVTKDELEFEYFGSSTNDHAQKHKAGIGYGVTESWFIEVEGNFRKYEGDHLRFDNLELENKFELTEPGEYWLDVGASLAYEWTPRTNAADALEARFILAKDIAKTSHVLNVIAEKEIGSASEKALEGALLWSSRYRYHQYFEPGFEIFSEFGELSHAGSFNDQEHAIGPAAYGKIPLGLTTHADAIKYRAGYLFGVSDAAADGDAFLGIEYELHF